MAPLVIGKDHGQFLIKSALHSSPITIYTNYQFSTFYEISFYKKCVEQVKQVKHV